MMKTATFLLFTLMAGLLFGQKNVNLISNLQFNSAATDIWGYVDDTGREYGLVCTENFLSIIDLADPANPAILHYVIGVTSGWRDVKVWDNFAYVTNESNNGIAVVDLNYLPDSVYTEDVMEIGPIDTLTTAHNIFIDENGIGYICGANYGVGGVLMIDLNGPDKFNPTYLGIYDDFYVHDCFVRGDTLWTAEISDGFFSVLDISDKANPVVLARQASSGDFTHNCWLTSDGRYLATTDEKSNAYVDLYDVSDLNNISRLDVYRSSPGFGVVPHNTFFVTDDYLYTSYYRDGLTIVDATRKTNMVEVGNYDTSPFISANGFEGAWGVYPYLPSGNILVSDREEGLFVLNATHTRAAYLEGNVTDMSTGLPVSDVQVELLGIPSLKNTTVLGNYATGAADAGTYDVRFAHPDCGTVIRSGIQLNTAMVTTLDVELVCNFPTSISQPNEEDYIEIFPNPFGEQLNILFESEDELQELRIYSATGTLLANYSIRDRKAQVHVSNAWPTGVYILEFSFKNKKIHRKLVKE